MEADGGADLIGLYDAFSQYRGSNTDLTFSHGGTKAADHELAGVFDFQTETATQETTPPRQ
eukprot:12956449-Heterocapsa_arctica.AAC.1